MFTFLVQKRRGDLETSTNSGLKYICKENKGTL